MATGHKTIPQIAKWKLIALMSSLAAVVSALLFVAVKIPSDWIVSKSVIQSFAALVLTSGIVSVIANILVRHELTTFWLSAIGVRDSVTKAGLCDVSVDFHSYDFYSLISASSHVDVMVIQGEKWFGNRLNDFKAFLSHKDHELRVCLLHEDSDIAPYLSKDFGYKDGELKQRLDGTIACLTTCISDLKKTGQSAGWLRIWKHRRAPKHSYYRFDRLHLLVPYNQAQGHTTIPVIGFDEFDGGVSHFLVSDFNRMLSEHAEIVYDSHETVAAIAPPTKDLQPRPAGA